MEWKRFISNPVFPEKDPFLYRCDWKCFISNPVFPQKDPCLYRCDWKRFISNPVFPQKDLACTVMTGNVSFPILFSRKRILVLRRMIGNDLFLLPVPEKRILFRLP